MPEFVLAETLIRAVCILALLVRSVVSISAEMVPMVVFRFPEILTRFVFIVADEDVKLVFSAPEFV